MNPKNITTASFGKKKPWWKVAFLFALMLSILIAVGAGIEMKNAAEKKAEKPAVPLVVLPKDQADFIKNTMPTEAPKFSEGDVAEMNQKIQVAPPKLSEDEKARLEKFFNQKQP